MTEEARRVTIVDDKYVVTHRGVSSAHISIWGANVTFRNCVVDNSSGPGIFIKGSNVMIERCVIKNSGSHGFYIAGANGQYRFNVIDGSRGYGNQQGIQIQYASSHGNRIYGNLMMNGRASGVVFSGQQHDNHVFNNVMINGGSKPDGSYGYAVNLYCEDGPFGSGSKFYNNTVIGKSNSGLIAPGMNPKCNGIQPATKIEVYNNIFYPSKQVTIGHLGPNIHDNIFYNTTGNPEPTNMYVNPMLANAMGQAPLDAMLTNGSPAIDRATGNALKFDYQNGARPYGMGYDIGAFEFGSPAGSGGPIVLPPGVGVPSAPVLRGPNGEVCPSGF